MTRPIPLTAPDGEVYAWACGACRHVATTGTMLCDYGDEEVATMADSARRSAETCCTCRVCGQYAGSRWARPDGDVCAACLPAYQEAERARVAALPPVEPLGPDRCPWCGAEEDE